MNCENIPHLVTPPFHAASLPVLYIQYTTPFTDPSKNFLQREAKLPIPCNVSKTTNKETKDLRAVTCVKAQFQIPRSV